ncbi:alpha/beta hydrolase [Streptomyces thermodiastaticus]|uniref:alpha/beta hydrolase n=1 Tax=Streptomyces thermodiastaticus TaxID=44061 RepID=UPI001675AB3A
MGGTVAVGRRCAAAFSGRAAGSTAQGGPEASHTTVIGHSYGSTTVGAASKAPGHLAADDIVVSGCWRAPEGTDLTTQY